MFVVLLPLQFFTAQVRIIDCVVDCNWTQKGSERKKNVGDVLFTSVSY